jgi:hypothetical protein
MDVGILTRPDAASSGERWIVRGSPFFCAPIHERGFAGARSLQRRLRSLVAGAVRSLSTGIRYSFGNEHGHLSSTRKRVGAHCLIQEIAIFSPGSQTRAFKWSLGYHRFLTAAAGLPLLP